MPIPQLLLKFAAQYIAISADTLGETQSCSCACMGSTERNLYFCPRLYAVIPPWKNLEASSAAAIANCNNPAVTLSATAIVWLFSISSLLNLFRFFLSNG